MLKIPLPAFYFDASKEDEWIVIDGLQRLTAFQNYLVGNKQEDGSSKKSCFKGMQYLTDFNGKTFDELPRQYIRRIKESSIVAYTVTQGTPDEVAFNIFQRINTGGIQLNDQEIRQALYSGRGTDLLKELAERKEFQEATQFAVKSERMLDREYVLRFLSFTELDYEQLEKIKESKEKFVAEFGEILAGTEFATALKAGDQYSLIKRVDTCRKFVKEFLCLKD